MNSKFYKFISIVFLCIYILLTSSCCKCPQIAITPVVIQCDNFRYEVCFPIDDFEISNVKKYLKKGGDKSHSGVIMTWYDESFYSGLLEFLKNTNNLNERDFFTNTNLKFVLNEKPKKWFRDRIFFGTIDSRDQNINITSQKPFCLFDGNMWWAFYKDESNNINKVIITIPIILDLRKQQYNYIKMLKSGD